MKNLLIVPLILNSILIYAQDTSYFGNSLTPTGNLHILIVFIGFDTTNVSDSSITWKHDSIPNWAKGNFNDIIDIDDSQLHNRKNITSYFHSMSSGNFLLTGEVYPDLIRVSPDYNEILDSLGNIIGYSLDVLDVPDDAIEIINLQDNLLFDYDYTRFDNRTNSPKYKFDNSLFSDTLSNPAVPDGKFDYIVFAIRHLNHGSNGLSNPGVSGTLFNGMSGFIISNGHLHTACEDSYTSFNQVFIHEMMHTIYGAPHTWGVNGVVGDFRLSRVTVTGPGAVSLQLLNTALI